MSSDRRYEWIQVTVVLVAMAVAMGHQRVGSLDSWFIEDAAISFAYARNLAEGEGLVPWPGGERVEGYSNPTWTFLLSLGWHLGLDPFSLSKTLGRVFSALTVPLAWGIAREACPRRPWAALVAPVVLATNPQQAIWAASGLENSLFNLLLAGALWRGLVEVRTQATIPWSAGLWALLALSRPEGILYAAVGGALFLATSVRRQGLRPTGIWLALFWIPVLAFVAWRYVYFAWPFPNTYYAKDRWRGLDSWVHFPGWVQLRDWSGTLRMGWLAPWLLLGVTAKRWPVALTMGALVASISWVDAVPVAKPYGVVLVGLLGLAGVGTGPGWQARVGAWCVGCAGIFFAVWSGGDWMNGFRWYAVLAVPLSVGVAAGAAQVARAAGHWSAGPLVAVAVAALAVGAQWPYTAAWNTQKETSPEAIKLRVDYMTEVAERLRLEHPPASWDVDQGAHLWWSDFRMMDMAGLIDVPVAHHRWEKPFLREYLFEESKPQLAHVHDKWAKGTQIESHREFERDYVEIPPYYMGRDRTVPHVGNYIRRDLVISKRFDGPTTRVRFANEATLVGVHMPSPETAVGRSFYVEVAMQARRPDPFRILFFATDEQHTQVWELPPGYDWIPVEDWRFGEIFVGRFGLDLPDTLPVGTYDIGVALLGDDGMVEVAGDLPAEVVRPETPMVSTTEIRLPDRLTLVTVDENAANAREDRERAIAAAEAGRCAEGEDWWFQARMHRANNREWWTRYAGRVEPVIARCWALSAEGASDAVARLVRAQLWDHRQGDVVGVGRQVADARYAAGLEARAAGDHETAYASFSDAVKAWPQHAWARRYAEEARDERLGIDPEISEIERAQRKARERHEQEVIDGLFDNPDGP